MELTPQQKKVFEFICHYRQNNGFPPSYKEIAFEFKFSSDGTVRTYLEHLENKGFIRRLGKARGIQILKDYTSSIPIIGEIAAGIASPAIENYAGQISDLGVLHQDSNRYALKIKGESMIDAGILDGDYAIIQAGSRVENGQIGAVLLDSDATLKRIFYEKNTVRLQAENSHYPPIILKQDDYEVGLLGKYIGLIRMT